MFIKKWSQKNFKMWQFVLQFFLGFPKNIFLLLLLAFNLSLFLFSCWCALSPLSIFFRWLFLLWSRWWCTFFCLWIDRSSFSFGTLKSCNLLLKSLIHFDEPRCHVLTILLRIQCCIQACMSQVSKV